METEGSLSLPQKPLHLLGQTNPIQAPIIFLQSIILPSSSSCLFPSGPPLSPELVMQHFSFPYMRPAPPVLILSLT